METVNLAPPIVKDQPLESISWKGEVASGRVNGFPLGASFKPRNSLIFLNLKGYPNVCPGTAGKIPSSPPSFSGVIDK